MRLTFPLAGSGAPYDGSSTWAARGTGSRLGAMKTITDIGGPAGTLMRWDGTYWVVIAPTRVIFDTASSSGTTSGADQVIKTGTLPIGILRACRQFIIRVTFGKSAGSEASSFVRCRLGSAGTTADTVLWENAPGLASANRSWAAETTHILTTATNVRQIGPLNVGGWSGGGTSFSFPQDKTVPDVDATALILSAGIDMSGTAETPQVFTLELCLEP
ncbi:hypothetical protein C1M51_02790 [Methylibium sp. Pch-M]|uniref:hypothetical protein n=1 Tax=Methylibium sp. Pch-M TaxID=2082386 RepID=UPI001012E3D7|nr:hypothetical protein [Methylibium sp. Pch-M]QAZ38432.1 hypothetical protein C1M51_02790 [Methylibium sp. Pch-M]